MRITLKFVFDTRTAIASSLHTDSPKRSHPLLAKLAHSCWLPPHTPSPLAFSPCGRLRPQFPTRPTRRHPFSFLLPWASAKCSTRVRAPPALLPPPQPPTSPPSPHAPFHPFAHRPGSRRRRRRRAARPPPRNPPRPAAMAPLRPHRRGRVTMPAAAEGQPPRATGLGGLLPWMCAGEAAPQKCSNSRSSRSSGRRRPRAAAAAAVVVSIFVVSSTMCR